jgi:hypothetical protein
MTPDGIRRQMHELIERLLSASISVKQFYPSIRVIENGAVLIGRKVSSSIALHDIPYEDVYSELEANEAYDIKLIDGGLLLFQYRFDETENLLQHRLAFFPSPVLPTIDESPALYEQDELYSDIVARRLVRFPIRFDYAPRHFSESTHPRSHLTLGQYEHCRIPVAGPLSPNAFGIFIIRNFYSRAYLRHKNKFDRRPASVARIQTISDAEKRMTHFVPGR